MSPATAPSWALVPDDLFTEFLSLLPVKSLLRFKCVSHSWNTLISDPNFVKLHHKKSKSNNPHFILFTDHRKFIKGESPDGSDDINEADFSIIPYPISSFVDNPSFTLFADDHYLMEEKNCNWIACSCDGLICLIGIRFLRILRGKSTNLDQYEYEYWLRLWNPATRAISEKFGCFNGFVGFNFSFGRDNSTGTFKVVMSHKTSVKVISFGDSAWRNIDSFPVLPLLSDHKLIVGHSAVFLNGTLNWLASHNTRLKYLTVEQLIILSLDLGTETYNMYKLPKGFDKMPPPDSLPIVGVLGDLLCFSYYYDYSTEADFIIWQMKKFGDEESWTQFLKISFHDLRVDREFINNYLYMAPLFLSKDGDTLVLFSNTDDQAILYNWRDHRVERSRVSVHKTVIDNGRTSNYLHLIHANSFVESLISIC